MGGKDFLFSKGRYKILFISILIIGLGFVVMSGGESSDPDIFNEEIYNFRRIKLAPLMIVSGFILCIFSILYNEKK
tara:strand:- start:630 stop:857 length:228 start_codon:yes stop_codon:yes gene_type:complete